MCEPGDPVRQMAPPHVGGRIPSGEGPEGTKRPPFPQIRGGPPAFGLELRWGSSWVSSMPALRLAHAMALRGLQPARCPHYHVSNSF